MRSKDFKSYSLIETLSLEKMDRSVYVRCVYNTVSVCARAFAGVTHYATSQLQGQELGTCEKLFVQS